MNSLLALSILLEATLYMDAYGDAFLELTSQISILKLAIIRFSYFFYFTIPFLFVSSLCTTFNIIIIIIFVWFLLWQAVEAAIELNLDKVEAGAQGGDNIQRGYMPVTTYSCHYILDEGFRRSISDFLIREMAQVISYNLPFTVCLFTTAFDNLISL